MNGSMNSHLKLPPPGEEPLRCIKRVDLQDKDNNNIDNYFLKKKKNKMQGTTGGRNLLNAK